MDRGAWWATVHRVAKSGTQLKRLSTHAHTFLGGSDGKESAYNAGDPGSVPGLGIFPGEGMATYSSILTWGIPWTKEPGGLQSMGLKIVEHN